MHKLKIFTLIISLFILNSCVELTQIVQTAASQNLPLTNAEIVGGLKDALLVGTDSSVSRLSAVELNLLWRRVRDIRVLCNMLPLSLAHHL